jgi:hypothetical protein
MAPPQARPPSNPQIVSDQLGARFDRECGQIGITDQTASGLPFLTHVDKNSPVSRAWNDRHTVWLRVQLFRKSQRVCKSAWGIENSRMCDDTEEAAEHHGWYRERLVGFDERF